MDCRRLFLLIATAMALPLWADVEYAGSKACAGCHKSIYDQYIRTGMGRSLTRVAADLPKIPAHVRDEKLNRDFRVYGNNGELFQSESERSNGTTVFDQALKLEYVIGSGANGMSFAVRRGNYLFQAPLSFYSKPHTWELSPGFETTGEGFGRPLHEACIVCHSGRPQAIPGREGLYKDPPFAEMAVGCENCHGPGALHVRRGTARSKTDGSIVNPARLSAQLADDICMRCHQGGAARVLLPARNYSDFLPGTPLVRTVAIFDLGQAQRDSDLLEHHQSMKLSQCYRGSAGKLRCISCHDPHQQPTADEAPAYFQAK